MSSKHAEAIRLQLLMADEFEQTQDSVRWSLALVILGENYRAIGRMEDAEEQILAGLEMARLARSEKMLSMGFNRLASVYHESNQLPKALKAVNKAYQISQRNDISYHETSNLAIRLGIFRRMEARDSILKALVAFEQHLETRPSTNADSINFPYTLNSIAGAYYDLKQYDRCIEYAKRSRDVALRNGQVKPYLQVAYVLISDAYKQKGNYKEAYNNFLMHRAYTDSLINEQTQTAVAEVESRYKVREAERENILLREQQAKQEAVISSQRMLQLAIIVGLILLAVIVTILILGNRTLTANNLQLRGLNETVVKQKHELEEVVKVKDKLFSVIAHDIRSPVAGLRGVLEILPLLTPEELDRMAVKLERQVDSLLLLLENLLSWSKDQMQGLTVQPQEFAVKRLVDETTELVEPFANSKKVVLESNVPEELKAHADWDMMLLVMRNLLTNALKFTPTGGKVKVNATAEGAQLKVQVQDSGVGISQEAIQKLLHTRVESQRGTANEKGSGLGLLLCREFIEKNGGTIQVESKVGKGSTFTFYIPAVQEHAVPAAPELESSYS